MMNEKVETIMLRAQGKLRVKIDLLEAEVEKLKKLVSNNQSTLANLERKLEIELSAFLEQHGMSREQFLRGEEPPSPTT